MTDLEKIQEVLDRQVKQDDQEALETKLIDCINLLGISAKHKANSHRALFKARGKVMKNYPDEKTAMLKLRLDNETASEQSDFILAERLNVSLAKAIDGLKAVLNISKEENIKW